MEQTVNWEKVYVDTLVRHTKDGGSHTVIHQVLRWQDL